MLSTLRHSISGKIESFQHGTEDNIYQLLDLEMSQGGQCLCLQLYVKSGM